jgi:hypothetical protein
MDANVEEVREALVTALADLGAFPWLYPQGAKQEDPAI